MKKKRVSEQVTSAEYRPYALAIGQAALAWNGLHEALCSLFEHLTAGLDSKIRAAWQSVFSDRAKRGMLKAVVAEMDFKERRRNPTAQEEMKWLFGQLDRLEDVRNDVVHAPLQSFSNPTWRLVGRPEGIQPDDIRGNRRAANLYNKDLLTEYRYCRDAALAFTEYVDAVQWAWRWDDNDDSRWPERPKLPNRGQKGGGSKQSDHQSHFSFPPHESKGEG